MGADGLTQLETDSGCPVHKNNPMHKNNPVTIDGDIEGDKFTGSTKALQQTAALRDFDPPHVSSGSRLDVRRTTL